MYITNRYFYFAFGDKKSETKIPFVTTALDSLRNLLSHCGMKTALLVVPELADFCNSFRAVVKLGYGDGAGEVWTKLCGFFIPFPPRTAGIVS